MKGIVLRFLAVAAFLVLLVGGTLAFLFTRGTGGVDDWVVRQVVSIVETYIVPRIQFASFDYHAPDQIELHDVSFTAPDSTEVIQAAAVRLTLGAVPRVGSPIVIHSVEIENGTLRLIRPAEGEAAQGTLFKGLAPFVKSHNLKDQDRLDPKVRLSEVLQIRKLALVNGSIVYFKQGDAAPMELTGLTLTLDLEPLAEGSESGWYSVRTGVLRPPIFELSVAGRVNLDTLVAELDPLALRMNLVEETYASLPPAAQSLLRRHDAVGKFEAQLTGSLDIRRFRQSTLRAGLWVDELSLAMGDYRVPVEEARFEATLADERLDFERSTIQTLDGAITLPSAEIDLGRPAFPAYVAWNVEGVRIESFLKARSGIDGAPKYAGVVTSSGEATLHAAHPMATLDGRGTVSVTQGRLVDLPVVRDLIRAMDLVSKLGGKPAFEDTATADLLIRSQAVELSNLDLRSQVVAARGSGTIGFDKSLDLELNAGPLEKVQSMLGPIGAVIGRITDQFMKYHITGRVGEVRVKVKPLGL